MGDNAKAVENTTAFSRRRHPVRINRRLDDRDNVIFEGLKNLEERPASAYPYVTLVPATIAAPSVGGGAATGLVLEGANFIGDATKSSGSTADQSGQLDLEAVLPGEQTITVTITDTGAALAVTADVAAGTIDIVHGDGGGAGTAGAYTVAEVAAAIDADAEAKFMVEASVGTAGDIDADETFTVNGGTGDLMTLDIGEYAIDGQNPGNGITVVTDSAITLDLDPSDIDGAATSLTVGARYPIYLRVDGVLVEMPFMVPAA